MNAATIQHDWKRFLDFYGEQNKGRLTRLGVFENQSDVFNDYWLEAGLPFAGIVLEMTDNLPTVEIILGDNFTHIVKDAKNVKVNFNFDGNADGFDVTDAEGKTTILRFEY